MSALDNGKCEKILSKESKTYKKEGPKRLFHILILKGVGRLPTS